MFNNIRSIIARYLRIYINKIRQYFLVKINGKFVDSVIIKSTTGFYSVPQTDSVIGYQLRHRGVYGQNELISFDPYLSLSSKVLIVGAHIGTITIPIAKKVSHVTAIEANPNTYRHLKTNIYLNDINNCIAYNIAASDKIEEIDFLMSINNSGGSKRKPITSHFMYVYDNPPQIKVKAYPLDLFINQDQYFDFILMDIEGSEYFALKGMQNILNKSKVLVIEFVPHHLKNISGVTVLEFLNLITPHFSFFTIPDKFSKMPVSNCITILEKMYINEEICDGIIFEKF